ncbi:MAG: tRNA (adenosine(37)-N6)-dimethylallyltransferase MiaA [Armatimonadota bacterium]|nr:tRNA (adenosine(37)-N6)-dimethylallyltransferase MiaA [Armatimonadota bacterium]
MDKQRVRPRVIAIVGPTAVGKTATAIELVSRIGGEIVSADSMAVYQGMDIGTAKPTADERKLARFHLIDVADPAKPFSVGEYQRLAQAAIEDIIGRNPPAIVVGGSGLYVKAAIDGLALWIPPRNEELRRSLLEQAQKLGNEAVHSRLAEVDPELAAKIHPNNLKRVIRALEIYEATGLPPSVLFKKDANRKPAYPDARLFGLTMRRETLYARINERVDAMIAAGLIQEVAALIRRGIDRTLPSMQGLGYKEIAGYLAGEYTLDQAVDLLKRNTRHFAKRQLTWFRADKRIKWIDVENRTASEVARIIEEELKNEQEPAQPAGQFSQPG